MSERVLLGATCLALCLASACGGGVSAQVRATVHPADRALITARRLDSLAGTFESASGCSSQDVITITGVASMIYNADGCGKNRDYVFNCRQGPYTQICSWTGVDDLALATASAFQCQPDTMDVQMSSPATPMVRTVNGCGLSGAYELQCRGVCGWVTVIPPTPVPVGGPAPVDGSPQSNGSGSAYIVQ